MSHTAAGTTAATGKSSSSSIVTAPQLEWLVRLVAQGVHQSIEQQQQQQDETHETTSTTTAAADDNTLTAPTAESKSIDTAPTSSSSSSYNRTEAQRMEWSNTISASVIEDARHWPQTHPHFHVSHSCLLISHLTLQLLVYAADVVRLKVCDL